MNVEPGRQVTFEYTLKLENNKIVGTNVDKEPLTISQGKGQIIQGLEDALEGMEVGERKKVKVPPSDGFGNPSDEAIVEISKKELPPETQSLGAEVEGKISGGNIMRGRVTELKKDTAIIDFNHRLAGETLYFDVKVLNIQ